MMRRLRLNFYRAEDAFLILKKRQWAEEDKEFTMKQEERKRNAKKKRLLRNKQRRERKEMELRSMSLPSLNNLYMPDENHSFITKNLDTLKKNFVCKGCKSQMHMGQNIYQCSDGHIICNICSTYLKVSIHSLYYWSAELSICITIYFCKECVECEKPIVGRNYTMERVGLLVLDTEPLSPTAPSPEDKINLTAISDSSV